MNIYFQETSLGVILFYLGNNHWGNDRVRFGSFKLKHYNIGCMPPIYILSVGY